MAAYWAGAGNTDIGLVRARNEDAYAVDDALGVYLVADGLGGHQGGNVASALAHDAVLATFEEGRDGLPDAAPALLEEAVRHANKRIRYRAEGEPALDGMGTTLTLLWLGDDAHGYAAHVGDSRLYRLDGGRFTQLSEDHTLAMEMVRGGAMTLEEAEHSFAWHRLTRVVGLDARLEVDICPVDAAGADAFLLCSDGLTGMVADDEIARLMRAALPDPRRTGEALIDAALAAGGDDNVTVVVVCRLVPSSQRL